MRVNLSSCILSTYSEYDVIRVIVKGINDIIQCILDLYLWCHLLSSSITTRIIIYEGMCVVVYMYTLMSNVYILCIVFW